jgi:hypothetical protein
MVATVALTSERRRAGRSLADLDDVVAPRVVGVGGVEEQLDVAVDRREQVVEVVRDPAGELSHGLHLLRLAELRGQLGAVGDVGHRADAAQEIPVLVANGRAAFEDSGVAAIAAAKAVLHFPARAPPVVKDGDDDGTQPLGILGMHARTPPLFGGLGLLPSEHSRDRIAPEDRARGDVVVEDHAAHALDGEPKPFVGKATLSHVSRAHVGGRGAVGVLAHLHVRCSPQR